MIEEAIIQRLLNTSGVSSIIGTRVYPGSMPQASALPALVFTRISGAPIYSDEGETGIEENRIQIDCWAATYTASKQLSRAVRGSLSAFIGTSQGVESLYCALDNERDLREAGANASQYLYRVSMDFLILNRS